MSHNKLSTIRKIALVLAVVMGLSPVPIASARTVKPEVHSFQETSRKAALSKIDSQLAQELKQSGKGEAIIYFRDQLDSEKVAQEARESYVQSAHGLTSDKLVRREVVQALKDQADESQRDILEYLEMEKAVGNVEEYTSYFVANVLYVKADRSVIETIASRGEVKNIFENREHKLDEPVTLPETRESTGEATGMPWNIERVNAPDAWAAGVDGTGTVVGVMDSGVDWTHPALRDRWRGYDPETGSTTAAGNWYDPVYGSALPEDSGAHGTHVTGTAVGQEPDGSNSVGVAPGAQWIAARIFNTSGNATENNMLSAGQWFLAPGGDPDRAPDVVNNSWSAGDGANDWYRDIVRNWRAAGIFPVFAAGNQRTGEPLPWPGSIVNPANYPESFAVGATDIQNRRAAFSKLGPSPYDKDLIKPNLAAPGVDIRSTVPQGGYSTAFSGTSMAAPHVAGTAALLRSIDQSLTPDDIDSILQESAMPLTDSSYPESPNFALGHGLLDAYAAVDSLITNTGIVTGQVLVEGEGGQTPVISHSQKVTETTSGAAIDIQAAVSDDVSVVEVALEIRPQGGGSWTEVAMTLVQGDHRFGTYQGTIGRDLLIDDTMEYRIRALDFEGNEAVTELFVLNVFFGVVPDEYFEGFEGEVSGWTFAGDWESGQAVSGFDPEPAEGVSLAGTRLGESYSANSDSWLVSPALDLRDPTLEEASFRLRHWYRTYNDHDYGTIYLSENYGDTWSQISTEFYGDSDGWKELVIDLSEHIGSEDPVYLGFRMISNASLQSKGWYIDDVRLTALDTEAPGQIRDLSARVDIRGIRLDWMEVSDGDLDHYRIYRGDSVGGPYTLTQETSEAGFLDTEAPLNREQFYVVTAVDASGNESEASNEVRVTARSFTEIFGSDFEDSDGGFVTGVTQGTANDWEWGIPTSGPGSAASGQRLWATSLSGDYRGDNDSYIESPTISIPEDSSAVLRFTHWYDFEGVQTRWDHGQILISEDDGATWNNVTPNAEGMYGGNVREWETQDILLEDYEGAAVKFRFQFHSDTHGHFSGWYIDDVQVLGAEPMEQVESREAKIVVPAPLFRLDSVKADSVKELPQTVEPTPKASGAVPAPDAFVTVLETGRVVNTDPSTGTYRMRIKDGTYTLRAEAYGYFSQEAAITVQEESSVSHTFLLLPKAAGSIRGTVKDRYYGEPAAHARISILEDPKIDAVTADENGNFTIEGVYEGSYTLRVSAEGFQPEEFPVTVKASEAAEVTVGLKRFVGYENEIAYDDGTAENSLVMTSPPTGLAVRFTPDQYGKVIAANVYLWNESFPEPGGNRLGFAVYDVDAVGGTRQVGETFFKDDLVRGGWNRIDLSHLDLSTDRDFYISTIQDLPALYSPAVGVDQHAVDGSRSYINSDGHFQSLSSQNVAGALMIRAIMEYSLATPVITNLQSIHYTNEKALLVEGTVATDGPVNVYVNGDRASQAESHDLSFRTTVELPLEINSIQATAELNGVETEPSPEITVILDQLAPVLEVHSPGEDEAVNVELVHVNGNVSEKYLDKVEINGTLVVTEENGDFHHRIILDSGNNLITIRALDLAGNVIQVQRTVDVSLEAPLIRDMTPARNITVKAGETVELSFRSDTQGGQASYAIALPAALQSLPLHVMQEKEPGFYAVSWKAPQDMILKDAKVGFELIDAYGNRSTATAPGTITVEAFSTPDPQPEVTRIAGSNRIRTAIEASRRAYDQADTVILASGYDFPDALAGAPLAEALGAPILLTQRTEISLAVMEEIQRLGAQQVILLGGELALSGELEAQLDGFSVRRLAGSNRFHTAALIAEEVLEMSGSRRAILTNGLDFPDALSVGPAAARDGSPVFFTRQEQLSVTTLEALEELGIETVTIIGGELAVGESVEKALEEAGFSVDRIDGRNRYATAVEVARASFTDPEYAVIASGQDFPDALAAGPLAAGLDAPLLLVHKDRVIQDVLDYLQEKNIRKVLILGGPVVIDDSILEIIEKAIR